MTEISREYAEALFELAIENGEAKEVFDGLRLVSEMLASYLFITKTAS